jgi:hypothetical protein
MGIWGGRDGARKGSEMADIRITSNFGFSEDIEIRDNSPLAKAKLTQLLSAAKEFFAEFGKPIDQADIKRFAFGAIATSPNLLSGGLPSLTLGAGINCGLDIFISTDGSLFGKDQFAIAIPIGADQAWLGVEADVLAKVNAAASSNWVGISLEADSALKCTTYSLFSATNGALPLLADACGTGFNNFSITASPDEIRQQPTGTVNQTECSGTITAKVTLSQPYTLNALASANLPFNATASIQPNVTLQIGGSISITGDFSFRSYKISDHVVQIGVYKKHGSTLAAKFTAGAGIGGNVGSSDVLGALLNLALPGADVASAGIPNEDAESLNKVIKGSIDRSLTAELNATCSAAYTDEAAAVYEIDLTAGVSQATDAALKLALQGDWMSLDRLTNGRRVRNIVVDTVEKKRSITLNLFGAYSATSYNDYLKTCTILSDESGQVSIIDKVGANRISAASAPYASDSDKLRRALTEDFICTATYAAISGKLNLQISVLQSYLDYQRNMSWDEMNQNIQLGYALGLIPKGDLDSTLNTAPSFPHACVTATMRYNADAVMNMFFSDRLNLVARTQDDMEQTGRETMIGMLNPQDLTDKGRIEVLQNNAIWTAMDSVGNANAFGTIEGLRNLEPTVLAAVTSDWVSIRWWADTVGKVGPILGDTLRALQNESGDDPSHDPHFMKQRVRLENVLGAVTRNTNAAFVHGWGVAVIFALSGRHGSVEMDLMWGNNRRHYGPE